LTQDNQWIKIKVPSQWSNNFSSSSQSTSPLEDGYSQGKGSDNAPRARPPPIDASQGMVGAQRWIEELKTQYDVKLSELAQELKSASRIKLEELELRLKDATETVRREYIPHLEQHHQDIHTIKQDITTIKQDNTTADKKIDVIVQIIKVLRNHTSNSALVAKINALFYPETAIK
jgi:hypothetical protein